MTKTIPCMKSRASALAQSLADLGWINAHNMRMDLRWGGGDSNRVRALAQELVGLQPDIIVTDGTPSTVALPADDGDNPDRICES